VSRRTGRFFFVRRHPIPGGFDVRQGKGVRDKTRSRVFLLFLAKEIQMKTSIGDRRITYIYREIYQEKEALCPNWIVPA
jgi:hypothetical protein